VGCYGGKREIMEHMAPVGGVFQAGTLSGNPVAMAAGLATLKRLHECDYAALEAKTKALTGELASILEAKGKPVYVAQAGSAFTMYFSDKPVTNMIESGQCDQDTFAVYWQQMMARGVYLAPAGFECAFTSFAHSDEDFEKTLEAARAVAF